MPKTPPAKSTKTTTKKPASVKSAVKKLATKKLPLKKPVAKKPVAKKPAAKTVAKKPAAKKAAAPARDTALLNLAIKVLEDMKAQEMLCIDLAGKSSMADWLIIASGTSSRQVVSMADALQNKLAALLPAKPRIEGAKQGDWTIVDAGDVVVHLFRPEVRSFYNLEKIWEDESEPTQRRTVLS